MNPSRHHWFALLAVEQELVSLEDLAPVWSKWRATDDGDLGAMLVADGLLDPDQKRRIDALVDRHQGIETRPFPEGFVRELETPGMQETLAGMPLPPLPASLGGRGAIPSLRGAAPVDDRYERTRVHATGGLGRVWLARDRHLARDVALKELRPELRGDSALASRFVFEAKITGQLEHPGIVPIYDLSSGRDAAPTYAMRFLQGKTLTEAIRLAPTLPERLKLLPAFASVCQTMAYAHSRGVIHRDLKGQNVLLGDFGEAIVLDWGLAKKRGEADAPAQGGAVAAENPDAGLTQQGQVLGTPFYMSPEQALGDLQHIDARSDVYSLGAILYEILTGDPPFGDVWSSWRTEGKEAATMPRLLDAVRTTAPTRPRLRDRRIPAALEAVCVRALEKEPERRYVDAGALAAEIQRWLADEPVAAYPDPILVRAGRWARKHRTLATSAGVFLVVAVVGLALATFFVGRERTRTQQALTKAEQNLRKAQEAVDRYFVQVSEDKLLDESGLQPLRRDLLATAREFFEGFARDNADDPQSRQAVGDTLLRLAMISSELGDNPKAREEFDRARAVFETLRAEQPDEPDHVHKLARCHQGVGYRIFLAEGWNAEVARRLELAESLLREAVKTHGRAKDRSELGNVLNTAANLYQRSDAIKSPEERARRVLEALEEVERLWKALADEDPTPQRLNDLAGIEGNLAVYWLGKRDAAKAIALMESCVELRRRLVREHPRSLEFVGRLSMALANFASAYRIAEQTEQAEKLLREAVDATTRLAKRNPFVGKFQSDLGTAQYNLGHNALARMDEKGIDKAKVADAGQAAFLEAATIYRRLADDEPSELRHRMMLGVSLASIGHLRYEVKMEEALPWYDQAIPVLRKVLLDGDTNPETRRGLANACWGRAECLSKQKQWGRAVDDWDEAIAHASPADRAEWSKGRTRARIAYAQALFVAGDGRKAVEQSDRAAADPTTAEQRFELARLLAQCAKDAAAKDAEATAAKAVAWLARACEISDAKDPTRLRTIEVFRALPLLADRDDFKKLVGNGSK